MRSTPNSADLPLVAVDDDPTGPQGSAAVPVLLRWDDVGTVRAAAGRAPGALHVITNSRSLDPQTARETTYDAAAAVVRALGAATPILMRGDSTLRAHVVEEYLAVRDAVAPGAWPALLLVPALPAAGRVTIDGIHLLEGADGARRPLHETEYAADPAFAYPDAELRRWAEYRSAGLFAADRGVGVPLADVRSARGPELIAEAIATAAASGGPAVVVPDTETLDDIAVIAAGWRSVRRQVPVLVRCGPAFVSVAAGTAASGLVDPGELGRALLVCGSHVGLSTRQLAAVEQQRPGCTVEVDVDALAHDDPPVRAREVARAAAFVDRHLDRHGFAVLATPRARPQRLASLGAGRLVADGLTATVRSLRTVPDGAIVKGGITSATVARDGFGAATATVVGPVEPGVALWELDAPSGPLPYVVVPGNVGDDGTLVRLADRLAPSRAVGA